MEAVDVRPPQRKNSDNVAQNHAGTNTITDTPAANPDSVKSVAGIEAAYADIKNKDHPGAELLTTPGARRTLSSLLHFGVLKAATSRAPVAFAVPLKSLRFLFPRLWPEAEADAAD